MAARLPVLPELSGGGQHALQQTREPVARVQSEVVQRPSNRVHAPRTPAAISAVMCLLFYCVSGMNAQ